jgi:type II secretory pathway pseudopilin PulG
MRLRDEQSGFTLVELVVSSAIGMVVLLALFGLVDVTQTGSSRVTQRVDASQRGRTAMEQMTQALRSVVCAKAPADASPGVIAVGEDQQVQVYTAIQGVTPGQAAPNALEPELREYRFDPAGDRLVETAWKGAGTLPNLTFPDEPRRRSVLTHVAAPSGGAVFSYFAFGDDGRIDPTPLATPLSDADRPRVARIGVRFVSRPSDGSAERAVQAPFDDVVSIRLPIDPSTPGAGPSCPV